MNPLPNPRIGLFKRTRFGDEWVAAYIPPPLPPEPPLDLSGLIGKLSAADRAVGRLDGITTLLPDHTLFLFMYVRKEAVLSSQIEGTQSTLTDLLRFETEAQSGEPVDDLKEVSNYISAMHYGLERVATLPLSLRLIREMHTRLMRDGRGASKEPGEFRRSQNWIGGSRPGNALYVPPPVENLDDCLAKFETFIHQSTPELPPLIKAGLLHLQFESIHPFLDGNGRLGRLLITLYLCVEGVLKEPLLYLSLYFKQHRETYYQLLQEVRERGNWEAWLEFFLAGVVQTANQAFTTATEITALFQADRTRISQGADRAGSALRVHELMQKQPFLTAARAVADTGLSIPTVNAAFAALGRYGIVDEITGRGRGRVYRYRRYMELLSDGTG